MSSLLSKMKASVKGIEFDICLICFAELINDARTINVARTYISAGKKVCIIAYGDEETYNYFDNEAFTMFLLKEPEKKKVWKNLLFFMINLYFKARFIKSKVYWAADFYSLMPAILYSKRHKGRVFYDSREIYSALGPLSNNHAKQNFITELEKRLINYVDEIIVSGEMDAEHLKNHFNTDHNYTVIMNLPPYHQKVSSNRIKNELNLDEDVKVLLYQGVVVKGRGIIPVIRALPLLENAVLAVIGWGPHKDDFYKIAEALNVQDRLFFLGSKKYDELFEYTASADLGISYIEPITLSYRLALPNKLFEYIMARIPSLISDLPAMKSIVQEYQVGEIITTGASPEEFAKAINRVFENKKKYIENCDEAAKVYCYEAQRHKILALLDN